MTFLIYSIGILAIIGKVLKMELATEAAGILIRVKADKVQEAQKRGRALFQEEENKSP